MDFSQRHNLLILTPNFDFTMNFDHLNERNAMVISNMQFDDVTKPAGKTGQEVFRGHQNLPILGTNKDMCS